MNEILLKERLAKAARAKKEETFFEAYADAARIAGWILKERRYKAQLKAA
jgi:hypothetical protein